jgi:hypothetical protein
MRHWFVISHFWWHCQKLAYFQTRREKFGTHFTRRHANGQKGGGNLFSLTIFALFQMQSHLPPMISLEYKYIRKWQLIAQNEWLIHWKSASTISKSLTLLCHCDVFVLAVYPPMNSNSRVRVELQFLALERSPNLLKV